jgi:hypothetical protein
MRLPVVTLRCSPVYAGWQLEQTSTDIDGVVDRTRCDVPQVVHTTLTTKVVGCCFKGILLHGHCARTRRVYVL